MVKRSLTTKRQFAPPLLLQAVAIIFCVAGVNAAGQATSSKLGIILAFALFMVDMNGKNISSMRTDGNWGGQS